MYGLERRSAPCSCARSPSLATRTRPTFRCRTEPPNPKETPLETTHEIAALDELIADAEERGRIEATELEAFALEHGLDEEALEHVRTVLAEHGVEINRDDDDEEELARGPSGAPAGAAPASRSRSGWSAATSPPRSG